VLSNSLLHYLHDPQVLWQSIRKAAKPGAIVLVMDLLRPSSAGWAESLVAAYAADVPEPLRRDFRRVSLGSAVRTFQTSTHPDNSREIV